MMKNLPIYMMLLAVLVMNIASVAHASCLDNLSDHIQLADTSDDSDSHHQDIPDDSPCECCAGTCSHISFVMSSEKVTHHAVGYHAYFSRDGTDYLSHLQYPPSRPPKA